MPEKNVQDMRLELHLLAGKPAANAWLQQNTNTQRWLVGWASSDGLLQAAYGTPQPAVIPSESLLRVAYLSLSVDARAFCEALQDATIQNVTEARAKERTAKQIRKTALKRWATAKKRVTRPKTKAATRNPPKK